jgi:hypothetical protein
MIKFIHKLLLIKIKLNKENLKIIIKFVKNNINQHGFILLNILI